MQIVMDTQQASEDSRGVSPQSSDELPASEQHELSPPVDLKRESMVSGNHDNDDDGESNQDHQSIAIRQQSVYDDVLGTNDQELARRQYPSDDADDYDDESERSARKRVALESMVVKRTSNNSISHHDGVESNGSQHNNNTTTTTTTPTSSHNKIPSSPSSSIDYAQTSNGYDDRNSSNPVSGYNENSQEQLQHYHQHHNSSNHHHQQHQHQHSPEEPEQMRKLFIGGLDYKTSEETLKQHFEKFGDVTDCIVMREPQSKRSRGFGFVIYANSSMVDCAQNARPHEVDGREVQSKRAISKEDSGKPEEKATVKKVYLGGISDDIEESELRGYFEKFGNIVNINIVAHKDTGKRRGFAFVEYDDYDPVDKIVLKKFHTIKDKRIEAKKAIPKVEMDARRRVDPRASMANAAMIALSGPPLDSPVNGRGGGLRAGRNGATNGACLWENGPYTAGYPAGYSGHAIDGYPPHGYYSPASHYGSYMMHGAQGGSGGGGGGGAPYGGLRNGHLYGGRSGYGAAGQAVGSWTTAVDYGNGFPASQGGGSGGGAGPMRLSYQHRGHGPYGAGYGAHRSRGYQP